MDSPVNFLHLTTDIRTPVERVFDLARDVDVHEESLAATGERAVADITEGVLNEGDRVTWRARHFGVPLELAVEVTALDRPRHFRDELVAGPLAHLVHDHHFEALDGSDGTRMTDVFRFASTLGPLGTVVEVVLLEASFRRLLAGRNRHLNEVAESVGE